MSRPWSQVAPETILSAITGRDVSKVTGWMKREYGWVPVRRSKTRSKRKLKSRK